MSSFGKYANFSITYVQDRNHNNFQGFNETMYYSSIMALVHSKSRCFSCNLWPTSQIMLPHHLSFLQYVCSHGHYLVLLKNLASNMTLME